MFHPNYFVKISHSRDSLINLCHCEMNDSLKIAELSMPSDLLVASCLQDKSANFYIKGANSRIPP